MYGLDYNYLSLIRDVRGREAAYAEQLKSDYYKTGLNDIIHKNNLEVIKSTELSSALIRESIDDFNSSLTNQFGQLSCFISDLHDSLIDIKDELNNIGSELNNISGILEWGFNAIIENQRLSLLVLTSIEELSKIPDREKERILLVQRALERQNEAFYNPELYKNAIKYYLNALELYNEDSFVLNRLGFIHLYSREDIDFTKSAYYFEESVKFILPKYYIKSHLKDDEVYDTMPGLLKPQLFKELRIQTSVSLFYAAQSNLLLNNHEKAKDFLKQSISIAPEFQEAKYLYIKTVLILKDFNQIESLINEILDSSPFYYFKFKRDIFFSRFPIVAQYTDLYYEKMQQDIDQKLNKMSNLLSPESILRRHYNSILALFRTNHFLGLVRAKKLINKKLTIDFNLFQYEP